ncbi:MAG: signal peptidase II [Elusimicrobia bacterium]|nr:signal peptidase II [Elusimicrobiota bacterium]
MRPLLALAFGRGRRRRTPGALRAVRETTRLGLIVAAVVAADRLTKIWAQSWLYPRSPIPLTKFFYFTYVENTGAAFGMMQGANLFFIGVSVVLLGGLFWMRTRPEAAGRWAQAALALVAGGALGNLYDRLAFGHVIDFLDFRVWPVFNVADSCISVGAVALAFLLGKAEVPKS